MQSRNSSNYKGIDVSHWLGNIDYKSVLESGVDIVYIKASEGKSYIDPMLHTNYINAKSQGLLIGFYHFLEQVVNQMQLQKLIILYLSFMDSALWSKYA